MIVSIFMGADSGAGGGGPGLTLAPPTRWSREAPCASHCMNTLKRPRQAIAAQGARAADGASRAIALIASSAAAFFASCFVLPFPSYVKPRAFSVHENCRFQNGLSSPSQGLRLFVSSSPLLSFPFSPSVVPLSLFSSSSISFLIPLFWSSSRLTPFSTGSFLISSPPTSIFSSLLFVSSLPLSSLAPDSDLLKFGLGGGSAN